MILVGTLPGDCCPHRHLISSVLNFLLFHPGEALGHSCGTRLTLLQTGEGSVPGDSDEGAESSGKDELDKVPVTPTCPLQ